MAAKMVAVKDLTPGCILADTVLSAAGKVLLGKDIVLTPRHISLLNTWDVHSVFINVEEEEPSAEVVEEPASQFNKVNSKGYLQFTKEYNSIITNTAQTFDFIRKQKIIPVPHLKETAGSIHSSIVSKGSAAMSYLLVNNHQFVDFITKHSVMVAYFAGIIAREMKWSEDDIRGVTLSGLLHDVGNLEAGKVEHLKNRAHIAEAAALIKKIKGLPIQVILGIIQHRECIDGSGFPTGVSDQRIHPYAKVIAVADTFHAQAYTDEYSNPFPVLDLLAHEMFGKLDPSVCHTFISRARDSLLNNKIILRNGQEAEVIYFHPNGSCLPVVKTADNQIIDLAQRGASTIRCIVSLN